MSWEEEQQGFQKHVAEINLKSKDIKSKEYRVMYAEWLARSRRLEG